MISAEDISRCEALADAELRGLLEEAGVCTHADLGPTGDYLFACRRCGTVVGR